MKAAVLHELKKPFVIEEVERPTPGEGEVLIKVEASGVCHSDLHVAEGDWKQFAGITKLPLIVGHEVAGKVAEVGPGVRELKVGDRVGVPWIYWTCGECEFCREGNENLCTKQKITGVTVDGGFAEFVKAPASHVTKTGDALSPAETAPLFCAGVTVYRALKQAKIIPGQRMAIFGIGGLGHVGIQIAREMETEITAIDVSEEKLAMARTLGAVRTVNAASANVSKEIRARGGAHIALVTSGARAAYDTAFACLRPTGTLLVVGLPAENICFPPILMAAREARIQASAVGTREDLREVLALASKGKVKCHVTTRSLDEVNDVMDQLRRGQVSGRVVLSFA